MKNVKRVIKGLLIGCVVIAGCLVNGINSKAQDIETIQEPSIINHYTDNKGNVITNYSDGSYYVNSDVEIQVVDKINKTVTINKDGELYSFYTDDIDNYYLGEAINITMDQDNKIVDCIVDNQPVIYSNVSIIYDDNEVCCVRIGKDVYDFGNDDGSYKVNDKVNIIIQNDIVLQVIPVK